MLLGAAKHVLRMHPLSLSLQAPVLTEDVIERASSTGRVDEHRIEDGSSHSSHVDYFQQVYFLANVSNMIAAEP